MNRFKDGDEVYYSQLRTARVLGTVDGHQIDRLGNIQYYFTSSVSQFSGWVDANNLSKTPRQERIENISPPSTYSPSKAAMGGLASMYHTDSPKAKHFRNANKSWCVCGADSAGSKYHGDYCPEWKDPMKGKN